MAIPVIVYGRSGTGKSSSMRNFKPGEVGIVNVLGKPLPFRVQLPSVGSTDYEYIMRVIAESQAKSIVLDDASYLITDMFMSRHASAGKGNGVFSLYNDIGDAYYGLLRFISFLPDKDKIVYLIMQEETDDFGVSKIKTIGKLLDEKVCIEGMTSVLLHSTYRDGRYLFEVNGAGIWKSPDGMFETETVDNDLAAVDDRIREYWKLAPRSVQEVSTHENH